MKAAEISNLFFDGLKKNAIGDQKYWNYDIKVKNALLDVKVGQEVQCIKAPCDPIKQTSYGTVIDDDYRQMIAAIFSGSSSNEIDIWRESLSDSTYKTLTRLLSYYQDRRKYHSTKKYDNSKYSKRGYYLEKDVDLTKIIISMGRKNTGGYSIDIVNIDVKGPDIYVTVKETSPGLSDNVTMALTNPCVEITVPFNTKVISIKDENNYEYKLIKK